MSKIKLGISSCLLGEKVRYDGGHKLDPFLARTLGAFVEYVPVCPEIECGLPTPRESMRLVGDLKSPRLVTIRSGIDQTERMLAWARTRVEQLEKEDLSGFIFKSKSPSSGMERVRIYDKQGMPHKIGVGLFARTFMERFPLLPVEDEGRLHDPALRDNFIERIFVFKRWREMLTQEASRGSLVEFHTRHKLLILSHSPVDYRIMGKNVAGVKGMPWKQFLDQYAPMLMSALRLKTTPSKHVNVMHHMLGYFKRQLSPDEKRELLEIIEHYHQGFVPLIVPLTLFNHYVRKYDEPYLKQQHYLNPHPVELQLRNHV